MTRTRKGFCMVAVCLVGVLLAGGIWWEYEGQININTSDAQTIYLLPGIDMEMAQTLLPSGRSTGHYRTTRNC